MSQFSYYYTLIRKGLIFSIFYSMLVANPQHCSICLQPLDNIFSVDPWGNAFHTKHEHEGIFCHSCSRIISQGVTKGGYIYSDGRHLCRLCKITAVHDNSAIQSAYESVISQFDSVGITNIPNDIPISLVGLKQLNQKAGALSHIKLKGFTRIDPVLDKTTQSINSFQIFILFGLPRIEFEAVLAHELLHVWLQQNQIILSPATSEGFCNLGRYLIYNNDQTQFSMIHLRAMEKDPDPIYGKEYRKMKVHLKQKGWNNLISYLMHYH